MEMLEIKFTAWIKVVVNRARLDYLRKTHKHEQEIFFEDLDEYDIRYMICERWAEYEFDSESSKIEVLSVVNVGLTETQRLIIEQLFIEEKTVQEISDCMGWCKQYIYNQKSLALKSFRECLYAKDRR